MEINNLYMEPYMNYEYMISYHIIYHIISDHIVTFQW